MMYRSIYIYIYIRGGSRGEGGVQRVPWNPPFERASLTRDTLIEQSRSKYSNRAVIVFLRRVYSVASYECSYQ